VAFSNRVAAGRQLARELKHLRGRDVVVLGLPCGGVPVAFEVARALEAPLDVIIVGKIGIPWQPELAMGAVGEDGMTLVNETVVRMARISPEELESAVATAQAELDRRVQTLAEAGPASRWTGGSRSSLTTASPPQRRPAQPARSPAHRAPPRSCSPYR
jgi:putative phosphoribosyl transferase